MVDDKESACNSGDPNSIPGSERSLCLHPTVSTLLPTYLKIPLPLAQLVKNPPAMQETPVQFLGREDPLERDRLPTPVFLGFPGGSAGKESTCNTGDLGSIPEMGRSLGEESGYLLQYSWASLVAQLVKNLPPMQET